MAFCEKRLYEEINRENQESVRRQTIRDYELIKVLGQGAFAKCIQVRHKLDGKMYAMKVISKENIMINGQWSKDLNTEEIAARNMYRVKQI